MIMKAVLTSSSHPEYGEISIPFPIPEEEYDQTIELLEGLGIGDVFAQDCRIVKLESTYPLTVWKAQRSIWTNWTISPSVWRASARAKTPSSRPWPTSWS